MQHPGDVGKFDQRGDRGNAEERPGQPESDMGLYRFLCKRSFGLRLRESALEADRKLVQCRFPVAFNFCPTCGCIAYWRELQVGENGRRRIAVNLRLAELESVASIPIDHFDGLNTFEDLPRDGRCVVDYWF